MSTCRETQDDILKSKLSIKLRKKGHLIDFKRAVVVSLSISESADLLGFSYTTISKVWEKRRKKISRENRYLGKNDLLMSNKKARSASS